MERMINFGLTGMGTPAYLFVIFSILAEAIRSSRKTRQRKKNLILAKKFLTFLSKSLVDDISLAMGGQVVD